MTPPSSYPAIPGAFHDSYDPFAVVSSHPQDRIRQQQRTNAGHACRLPDAASYQLRWGPVGASGRVDEWTIQPVAGTKRPTLVTGLTPGTTYVFQVQALIRSDSSLTDWSDPLTKISM